MSITVYHYPRCGTCKKALKWLEANGVSYEARLIAEAPPSAAELRSLWTRSGLPLKRFFNTSGKSYRGGNFKARLPTMGDEEKLTALSADGMLIKRPIVDLGERVLVGFRAAEYEAAFG